MDASGGFGGSGPVLTGGPLVSDLVVRPESVARARRRLRRGDKLHCAGDAFESLYVVHAGVFKTLVASASGMRQVTGFQMPGDVIGLCGIETGRHASEAVALEDGEVLVVPFMECKRWVRESAHGQRLMARTMAAQIGRCHEQMILLGTMRAPQRLAVFLLDLSQRYGHLGYSRSRLVLRMTRREIGSYLGLTIETVCRVLTRMQQERLIHVQGKSVSLLDSDGLWRMSGLAPEATRPMTIPVLDPQGALLVA